METIRFWYRFSDEENDNECKIVEVSKETDGLPCHAVCEMFMDFMESCGYAEENIRKYFRE